MIWHQIMGHKGPRLKGLGGSGPKGLESSLFSKLIYVSLVGHVLVTYTTNTQSTTCRNVAL